MKQVTRVCQIYKIYTKANQELIEFTNKIMSSPFAEICYLESVEDPEVKIILPHNEAVAIGRNSYSLILDRQVSRKQMILKADYETQTVSCCVLGSNASGYNGFMLYKDRTYQFRNNCRIEVILGCHFFDLVFKMSETKEEEKLEPPAKKQKFYSIFEREEKTSSEGGKIMGTWEVIDKELLVYTPEDLQDTGPVAAFDMDGTIIKTKSGHRFPVDTSDWTPTFANVHRKLKELYSEGFRIVIFTNQSKLGQESKLIPEFKEKIEVIVNSFGVPFNVFIATGKGIYRKPCMGMWDTLLKYMADVNMDKSFYVGDAAGREKNWAPHKPKDHSLADRLFAMNIGLKFYTPEEYFLGTNIVSHIMPDFDPKSLMPFDFDVPLSENQEVIVMVGSQASGKSFFCKKYLIPYGYVRINRDTLGSKQRCLKVMESSLQEKQSVVIDNTNPDVESRKAYIQLARQFGVPCRCFYMSLTSKHAKHNNKFRLLTDKNHIPISEILLNSYKKQFQEPSVNEGFLEVIQIQFNPSFDDPEKEKIYRMFLLEN